jgi:hypothetical protein
MKMILIRSADVGSQGMVSYFYFILLFLFYSIFFFFFGGGGLTGELHTKTEMVLDLN